MKYKIIIGSIMVVILILMLPSIAAVNTRVINSDRKIIEDTSNILKNAQKLNLFGDILARIITILLGTYLVVDSLLGLAVLTIWVIIVSPLLIGLLLYRSIRDNISFLDLLSDLLFSLYSPFLVQLGTGLRYLVKENN